PGKRGLEALRITGDRDGNVGTAHWCLVGENRKSATLRHEREGAQLRFLLANTLGAVLERLPGGRDYQKGADSRLSAAQKFRG
ncbi:hypothetical protein, partial [Sinorhizobium medicae]|uniref:hypothetical protein n=1 Tax=Sinorhizobium medicae TaxID=110321 RepID=UPI001AED0E4F